MTNFTNHPDDHMLEELLAETEGPCVSIVIPGYSPNQDVLNNVQVPNEAINLATHLLQLQYPERNITADIEKHLHNMALEARSLGIHDSYGIYASSKFKKLIRFPFDVSFKIKVGNYIDLRDLLYYTSRQAKYFLLSISKKHLHLFSGNGADIQEIKEGGFPFDYEETYEYARPTRGNSYSSNMVKGFEKDKSVMQEIRLKSFMRKADAALAKYIHNGIPLVIAGGTKEIADFLDITKHSRNIVARVNGQFACNGSHALACMTNLQMKKYFEDRDSKLIADLHEEVGYGRALSGIENIWKSTIEGKGLHLVIEKDFEVGAFIRSDEAELKLNAPVPYENFFYVEDAVARLIWQVRNRKGKISFVNNGALTDMGHIALLLRYP